MHLAGAWLNGLWIRVVAQSGYTHSMTSAPNSGTSGRPRHAPGPERPAGDTVGPVIFLLSRAAFVTGVDLLVDGGHVIW